MHFNPQRLAIFKGANRGDCFTLSAAQFVLLSGAQLVLLSAPLFYI
jgi:CBS-domain-containing membrane protein